MAAFLECFENRTET